MRASLFPWAALFVMLSVAACGGGSGGDGGGGPGPQSYGLGVRTPLASHNFPGVPPTPRPVDVEPAFPNVNLQTPIYLTSATLPDGSSRLFVVQQGGIIRVFRNDDTVSNAQATNFLDITPRVTFAGEQGLLGLAFDPDFGTPGHAHEGAFYVHYSAKQPTTIGDRALYGHLSGRHASRGHQYDACRHSHGVCSRTPITTPGALLSAPTTCSTSRWAMVGQGAIPRTTRKISAIISVRFYALTHAILRRARCMAYRPTTPL